MPIKENLIHTCAVGSVVKAYNFFKAQAWHMTTDHKADKRTNRSFKRSERMGARRQIRKTVESLFFFNGNVYDDREIDYCEVLREHYDG